MNFSATELTVVTATRFETRIVRRMLPGEIRVFESGVGLVKAPANVFNGPVISCGLAGSVRDDVATGTVLIPSELVCEDGTRRPCERALVEALLRGATRCGIVPLTMPLGTSRSLVRGRERERYAV
ncbi:MAG: hypothetical protein JO060_06860, partial [Candidatus Eremiobacteraeota bacterium]|nr:hypothetical protein [Candidatus Eremiobacteraeota bacterium]